MLKDHKLLIDKNCPMCAAYGKCFTHFKLIDKSVLDSYQEVDNETFEQINQERAKSEIALVNVKNGVVLYGLTAFLEILFPKKGVFYRFLTFAPINFLLRKVYRFISYNRHVITGGKHDLNKRNCIPATHKPYRWTYILFTAIITGIIVNLFTIQLDTALKMPHYHWREFLVCFGQIAWQFGAISFINSNKRLDYLGNMSTVSLIGGLLLIPLLIFNHFIPMSLVSLLMGFGIVVGIMFMLHVKRCKELGLPLITSISWVMYRSLVLLIILLSITL